MKTYSIVFKIIIYILFGLFFVLCIDAGYSYLKTILLVSKPDAIHLQITDVEHMDITNEILYDIKTHDMYDDMPEDLSDTIKNDQNEYSVIKINYIFYAGVNELKIWDIRCDPKIDDLEVLYYTKGDGHAPFTVDQKNAREFRQYVFIKNEKFEKEYIRFEAEVSYHLGYGTYHTLQRFVRHLSFRGAI